ncbi:MAG: DUF4097 family beta strand repeat-containing protein [Ruminococcus sp.]
MKKFLIIGCIVLSVGLIVFVCGFALSGWDIFAMETQSEFAEKTYTSSEKISTIQLEDDNTRVELTESSDDKVHITYFENEKESYEIKEDKTLLIKRTDSYKWYDYIFNIRLRERYIEIKIPQSFGGNVILNTGNGKIGVQNIKVKSLSAHTSNGSIDFGFVQAGEDIKVITSNGSVNIQDTQAKGTVDIKTSNASVTLGSSSFENLSAKSSNGKIQLLNVKAENEIYAETSNGKIDIERISAEKSITLKTSNAGVTGTVLGTISDFTVTSHTSNGNNNLPENMPGGDKQLNVDTSNGKIDVSFEN